MKSIRITLVALIAVFALSAVAASSASASPEWYVKKAGKFAKLIEPVKVAGTSSFELKDTLLNMGLACTYHSEGEIKPGGISVITTYTELTCRKLAGCEKFLETLGGVFVNRPWQTALYTEGSEIRGRIGENSNKQVPEFAFSCEWNQLAEYDACQATTTTKMTNNASGYVEETFDTKTAKTRCKLGGEKTGEWKGTLMTIKPVEKSGVEAIKVE